MKTVSLFVLMALLGLCIISAGPASAVIIYSNGFNTDTDGDGVADGWNAQPEIAGLSALEPDNKVEGAFSQDVGRAPWKGIYSDPISGIVTGQTYTLDYWIYTGWNRAVDIWGDGKFSAYYLNINTGGQWVHVTDTIVASANANPAQIYITAGAQTLPILVDAMTIDDGTPIPEPSALLALASGVMSLAALSIRRRS